MVHDHLLFNTVTHLVNARFSLRETQLSLAKVVIKRTSIDNINILK